MNLTATLTDTADKTSTTQLTAANAQQVQLTIGAATATVLTDLLSRAVANALNGPMKAVPGYEATATIPQVSPATTTASGSVPSSPLTVASHPTDRTQVLLTIGSATRTHAGADLQKAIRVLTQP
jgi:hypothetical protein